MPPAVCFRCSGKPIGAVDTARYAYLLGLYLGDGHIVDNGKTHVLRIYLDDRYPGIIESCRSAMGHVLTNKVHIVRKNGCSAVCSYSQHWPCMFPQHGPGPKHKRRITLADWQEAIVKSDPRAFLRGLVHSDGCRSINNVTIKGKKYAYPRSFFSNRSPEILGLFGWACDLLGVTWRQNMPWSVNVARRADVALLDTFIGPKS